MDLQICNTETESYNIGLVMWNELHKQEEWKFEKQNLTLYAWRIILQYVYKPTRCTQFLWLDFLYH